LQSTSTGLVGPWQTCPASRLTPGRGRRGPITGSVWTNPHRGCPPRRSPLRGVRRLFRPRVLPVALYHPEFFPLPRFALAISDLARAARSTLLGQVRLMDLQLGVTVPDILAAVDTDRPDVVGVSATFGRHDIMVDLLDRLFGSADPPLVLAGGSLTARNEQLLLDQYPRLLVARRVPESPAVWADDPTSTCGTTCAAHRPSGARAAGRRRSG
jgi:hypothetical protein